jgi:ABC-type multidrug transport system fused ATPase/permease subunit
MASSNSSNFVDAALSGDSGQKNTISQKTATGSKLHLGHAMLLGWELVKPRRLFFIANLVLIVVNRVVGLVLPLVAGYLVDHVMIRHQLELLPRIVAAVLAAVIFQAATSYILTQELSKAAYRLITDLRMRVQSHIGLLPLAFFDENKTGTLAARVMKDVEGVRYVIGTEMLNFIGGLLTAILAFCYLILLSITMTLLASAALIITGFIIQGTLTAIYPVYSNYGKIYANLTGRLTESMGGIRVVKGYHAEASEANVFAQGVDRLLEIIFSALTLESAIPLISKCTLGTVGALIMYLGAHSVLAGEMTVGGYVTYLALLALMIAPVGQLSMIGPRLAEAFAGLGRTHEILNQSKENIGSLQAIAEYPITGDIRFDEVSFEYRAGKPVLHNISFRSTPGTVTAIVGSSGSGKSTITALICGFYNANRGRILVDGVDLSNIPLSSYRRQLGVVLQDTFLFEGSIRENVLFSRPTATEEQLIDACRIARVDEFAHRLPDSYDTIIGERGVKLSGGQQQRISIARAILADPRILILDEATSSLDSQSEEMIQDGLNLLMQGRTTFVIAHRLSTIFRADQILLVEQGNIIECGTHESLCKLRGRYFDLYMHQYGNKFGNFNDSMVLSAFIPV